MNKGILLSGGMDSVALMYWKRPNFAFTIDYGQKPAEAEIRASVTVSKVLNIPHHIITVDCGSLGMGDLSINSSISLAPSSEWWPYRNQLLVTLACMKGIVYGMEELIVGSVKTDEFHRDGTREFYTRLNEVINYQEGQIKVSCPAVNLTTAELIRKSGIPDNVLLWAHSCHKSNIPCGNCRGCYKYIGVIQELYGEPQA